MISQELVQLVLVVLLLLCGYIYLFQIVARRTTNKAALPLIAVVLLLLYAAVTIPLMYLISQLGSMEYILIMALILLACVVLFAAGYGLIRNFSQINKKFLILFILYILVVSYVTIFGRREGENDTSILMTFDSVRTAFEQGSFEPLNHLALNVVMFVPLGFLFPLIDPEGLDRPSYAFFIGLMASTIIESVQLLLRIGQCDAEDILANTVGAIVGLYIFRIAQRIRTARENKEE